MSDRSATLPPTIGVLGAGVIGLQTALILKEAGFDVVMVAKDFPGSEDALYTSTWSGAQWRSNIDIGDQQDWDRQTFLHWSDLANTMSPGTLGLKLYPATYLWDHAEVDFRPEESHWWAKSYIPNFHVLSSDEVRKQGHFAAGMTYETFALWPPRYLSYLHSQCEAQGIRCYKGTVPAMSLSAAQKDDIFHKVKEFTDVVGIINCTGVAAAALTGDPRAYPSKGQTVVVAGTAQRLATRRGREGWEALVIPWPGSDETMLGGCKIPGEWSTQPDEAMTKTILERCKPLAPELLNADGEFEVRRVRVGLRPGRHGGPRIEVEKCCNGSKFVCHAYGHDSAGYEGSLGIARHVLKLVVDHLAVGSDL